MEYYGDAMAHASIGDVGTNQQSASTGQCEPCPTLYAESVAKGGADMADAKESIHTGMGEQ